MKPLGERINEQLAAIQEHTRDLRILARSVECDSELPAESKITESHLDDLKQAKVLISQAAALVENLTQRDVWLIGPDGAKHASTVSEIEVTITIPAPPDGWRYDGYRQAKSGEMYWIGEWHTREELDGRETVTLYEYAVAVKVPPPWEPPPEIVAAVLLLHGPGWIVKDSDHVCRWHRMKPENEGSVWWSRGHEVVLRGDVMPRDVDWTASRFKIGDPQQ